MALAVCSLRTRTGRSSFRFRVCRILSVGLRTECDNAQSPCVWHMVRCGGADETPTQEAYADERNCSTPALTPCVVTFRLR